MWDSTEELHIQQRSSASPLSGTLKQRSISVRCGLEATLSALVLGLLGPFAALRARSVQKLLLGIVVLDVPLQLGTHFFYREADASSGALGGLSISVTTIALLDRKSTRLNSSHSQISYAVFCLNKKTATAPRPFAPLPSLGATKSNTASSV